MQRAAVGYGPVGVGDRRSARPRLAVCAGARPRSVRETGVPMYGLPSSVGTASRTLVPCRTRPPETQGGDPAVALGSAGQTGRQTGSSPPLGGLAEPVVYLPRRTCPR